MALLLPMATEAEEITDEPVGFEIAYLTSFYEFDFCGDSDAGRVFRTAIVEKIKACPYSAKARERFLGNIALNMDALLSTLLMSAANNRSLQLKPPPEAGVNPDGSPMTCADYLHSPPYLDLRKRLMRYADDKIGVDEALGESDCPSGPTAQ